MLHGTQTLNLPAFENQKYAAYDGFYGNGSYGKNPNQERTNQKSWIYLKITLPYNNTLLVLFHYTVVPPRKRLRRDQEDIKNERPSEEALGDLAQHITPFWKPLGRKLRVPNAKLDEIQSDNVQYPAVKEKACQMLMVWLDLAESPTFGELSRALRALGKNRLAKEHCNC